MAGVPKQKPRRKGRGGVVAAAGLCLAVGAVAAGSLPEPTVTPGTKALGVALGGMRHAQAVKALEERWSELAAAELQLVHDGKPFGSPRTPPSLGLSLDVEATLAEAPMHASWESAATRLGLVGRAATELAPVWRHDPAAWEPLAKAVRSAFGTSRPARVRLQGGTIVRSPEEAGHELDVGSLPGLVESAVLGDGKVPLPLRRAPVRVGEAELAKVTGPIGAFSTRFSEGNRPRSHNIRAAARLIDGAVLMPGDRFDFNSHLGRRTTAKGFQVAGVYVSGRHDFDVGGGICQVSTTLFNAVLQAGLPVLKRSPHSLPVPYVPLGRDAAVSYPEPNLAFENGFDFPIALTAAVAGGKITFTVLGDESQAPKVAISQRTLGSWSRGVKYIEDKSLAPGSQRVEDRGGAGHRATTTRVVTFADGREHRETFESVYGGGPRIVRINRSPKPAAATAAVASVPPPAPARSDFDSIPPPSG
jgi:vancomycin resistance protein YoaR